MKLGVVFPQTELPLDPAAIRDFALAAEDLGYDYLLAYDHVLGALPSSFDFMPPYNHETPFHEPFVLFGYLAGLVSTLEFVTGILILPQRQTALVAKQAAQVDFLSGGRLRLGIGIGWNHVEYEALGKDFSNRGRRTEEQVAVLRKLWTEPLVTFEGKEHAIHNAGIKPLPVQRPIPIWFGGTADIVLRRMARLGDGWFPQGRPSSEMGAVIDKLHGYLNEAGRDPAEFGIDVRLSMGEDDGSRVSRWQQEAEQWQALGATHVSIATMRAGLETTDAHIQAIREFRAAFD